MRTNISANVALSSNFVLNAALKESEKSHNAWRKEERKYLAVLNYMWQHHKELVPLYESLGIVFEKDGRTGEITKRTFKAAIGSALDNLHVNCYGHLEDEPEAIIRGYWSKRAIKDENGEYVLNEDGKRVYEPRFVPCHDDSMSEMKIWKMLLQSKSFELDASVEEVIAAAA